MLLEPLHAVTVSVGYADYLDIALTHNRHLFSEQVVVSNTTDTETHRVAGKHACTLIKTDEYMKPDGSFSKGSMIERGLQQLPNGGWRIHYDADIVIPANARQRFAAALHDKQGLYGVDRFNVVGWDAYQELLKKNWHLTGFENHHFLNYPLNKNEIMGRLMFRDEGYLPIGYFQMWHDSVERSGIYRTLGYPRGSHDAAHDDVQFALRFERKHRHLIPEFFVAHLTTNDAGYGKNWNGRRTKQFGPPNKQKQAVDVPFAEVIRGDVKPSGDKQYC